MSNPEGEKMISKDIDRTFAYLKLWREDLSCGNNALYNVLLAYSNFDNEVGYVQGINYIIGIMLFYIKDQEQVFWAFVTLMHKQGWRWIYTDNFPKLQSILA